MERRYRPETLVLETTFERGEGAVRLIDFMPPRERAPVLARIVEGVRGRVEVATELVLRFDYGASVPWVRRVDDSLVAIAGPNAVRIDTPVELRGEDLKTRRRRSPSRRATASRSSLTWYPSHLPAPEPVDAEEALEDTRGVLARLVRAAAATTASGPSRCAARSALLKALTYEPTGGIVAAPTTSLPEWIGGVRNWDYRYCWLRDATLTIVALLDSGYLDEARAWRDWLFRAAAGDPADLQIMYGVAGERRLPEFEIDWLPGYEGSRPVRVGNAASEQFQLDVYGEVIDAFYTGRVHGLEASDHAWQLSRHLLELPGVGLATARRRDLGGARPEPPLHPLEGDGVGGVRPRGADGRDVGTRRAGRPLARGPRRDPRRRVRATATTPSSARSPSRTGRSGSTRACC